MPRTCLALLFGVPFMILAAADPSSVHADDDAGDAWTELSADPGDAAWRDGPKSGWSAAADAHLDGGNNDRLVGDPGRGALVSRGELNLSTASDFGDVDVRMEFMIPRNSNSGVKLNGHYELQIRDTHGKPVDELTGDDCGGVYPRAELGPPYKYLDSGVAPRVNAARAAGEWQSLEISFRAPRFDASGKKMENARFKRVVLNGEVIHDNLELKSPTGAAWDEQAEVPRGPLLLQGDHGHVAFRKLAIRPR